MRKDDKFIGIALTLLGATFWGVSGTCAQYLQVNQHINTEWILTLRLFMAGFLTVFYRFLRKGMTIFDIFKNRTDSIKLLIFGIFGIMLCQYAYFRTIIYAGAGIATVIQYLAPIFIIFYLLIFHRRIPTRKEIISVILAILGASLIALKGTFDFSAIDGHILFWGLLSAIAVAIYSLQPVELLAKYGTGIVVGWGMIAGGFVSLFIWEPLASEATINIYTYMNLFGVIVMGSALAFNLYLDGVRRIGAVQGSVISAIEPVAAAVVSYFALGNVLSANEAVGFSLIILTIFILALSKK